MVAGLVGGRRVFWDDRLPHARLRPAHPEARANEDFDPGAAKKFVLDTHGMVPA
jgi:hypothetical protein